ncbi:hypothetical protein ACHAW5_011101 [Stephanodiscus triporus]|uniref:SnoaL-like domain-containing protein n=1 Tax=Stephanodiscus triporus TaxID=2934178 RepID=A0ABD3P500_9STRA
MSHASRPRQQPLPAEDAKDAIAAVLDDFHDAASRADGVRYFRHFAADGIFLGTDANERWTIPEFREYAEPHFSMGIGWTYVPLDRRVSIAACGTTAWFDERLRNDKYGECRGSGVLVMSEQGGCECGGGDGGEWRIAQYNLAVPIPNDMLADVARRIREFGTPAGHTVPASLNITIPEEMQDNGETQDLSETPENCCSSVATAEEIQDLSKALESSRIIAEKPSSTSYRPKASSLPTSLVRTIQLESDGDDDEKREVIPTTMILQLFSDRIFFSITQLSGKMGSLLVCNVEESIIDNSTTYHISTLLGTGVARRSGGRAEQEVSLREVYVRRLAERIVSHARKMAGVREGAILGGAENGTSPIPTLVVGLGLRPNKSGGKSSFESFNAIVDAAMKLYEEGWRICHSGGMVGMEGPD